MDVWSNRRCPGCSEDLISLQPKLLSCFHPICSKCVISSGNKIGGNGVLCVVCKQESHLTNILDNEFVKDLEEKSEGDVKDIVCTCCDDKALASSFCCNCTEYLCEVCVMAHGRTRMTKHHKIKPKGEVSYSISSSIRTCSQHKFEQLTWYCLECKKVTCRDCQLLSHRNHEYVSLDEVGRSELEKIKNVMKNLEFILPSLRNKKTSIMKMMTASEKELEETKLAVNEQAQNVKKLVDEWESSILNTLNSKVDPHKNLMTSSANEIDKVMISITNASQFIDEVVTKSNCVSVLRSKDFIIKQLKELINRAKLDPVFTANSYEFFGEKTKVLANCIKRCGYITEKDQNVDTVKYLIASVSAADKINEEKLVQCRSCHTLTDFGPSCQFCGMPIPHNLNPVKRQNGVRSDPMKDPHMDEDSTKYSSISQDTHEHTLNLESMRSSMNTVHDFSLPSTSKEHVAVEQMVEASDNAEKKTKTFFLKSSQKVKKSVIPCTSVADDDDGGEIEEDRNDSSSLIISSSDDEDFKSKKLPKRGCKRSSSTGPKSTSSTKRGRGRQQKAGSCRSTPAAKGASKDLATPGPSGCQSTSRVDLSNINDLRQLLLVCRSVRIGSLKTLPMSPIDISVDGIAVVVKNPQEVNGRSFHLLIPTKLIVGVSCHFGRSLPVMYVYTNNRFKEEISKKFGDEAFDPDGEDESKKRIIILPEKFNDEDRMIIKNIFKDISLSQKCSNLLAELDVKAANSILVKSTPSDQK